MEERENDGRWNRRREYPDGERGAPESRTRDTQEEWEEFQRLRRAKDEYDRKYGHQNYAVVCEDNRHEFRDIEIENQKLSFLADTGADISCMDLKTVEQQGWDQAIRPTRKFIRCFGGGSVEVLGELTKPVRYQTTQAPVNFLIVEGGTNVLANQDCVRLKILKWLNNYNNKQVLAYMSKVVYKLYLKPGACPVAHKERPVPFALRAAVTEDLNRLIHDGVLVPAGPSNWASPIVVVRRSNGTIRICGDFRSLNSQILSDKYPLPNIEDLLAKLGTGNTQFAKIDLKNAYHQIPLATESQELTTIITHLGTFRYTKMPFGVKSAPSAFQRIMTGMLGNCEGVFNYLDDILVAAPNREILRERVRNVRDILKENEIEINTEKTVLETSAVEWLGYEISSRGLRPTLKKAEHIGRLKDPENVKQARQVMGVVNYYGRFIPSLAQIAHPIHSLLEKGKKWKWGSVEHQALEKIKKEITKRPVVAPFETAANRRVVLKCDACESGMGAVLEQEQPSGQLMPVAYWSSRFRKYERNYSISEKEALSCVSAMVKFRKYLLGRHFTLQTDHKALETLLAQDKSTRTAARVERWRERVACFSYDVEYIKGETNEMADWLSRSAEETMHRETPLKEEYVVNQIENDLEYENDPTKYGNWMIRLSQIVKETRWNEDHNNEYEEYLKKKERLTVWNNKLYYDRTRFIPDPEHRGAIVQEAHKIHQGVSRTANRVGDLYWWPRWRSDVEDFISNCEICTTSDRTQRSFEVPLHPVPLPEGPWQRIAVDIKGPIKGSRFKYLIVAIDYFSKWPEIIGVMRISSFVVIRELQRLFARHGTTKEIITDNGTQFVSGETKEFLRSEGVQHRRVPLYAPQQNGLVERFNRTIAEKLKEAELYGWNVEKMLTEMLKHYRSTPHSTTGITPFEGLYGRRMRNRLSQMTPIGGGRGRRIDREMVARRQEKMKEYFDRIRRTKEVPLRPGNWVRLKKRGGEYGIPRPDRKSRKNIRMVDGWKKMAKK